MRNTFVQTLLKLAANDPRICLLTADLGYSVLEAFAQQFPDRFVNVGVAEQNLIGVAAGMAHSGLVPFVYSIANFPTLRCLEQIRIDVCYHDAPVKIVAVGGGLAYGAQGYTHHGVEDLAVMRSLPGMTVVAPADPVETRALTAAIAEEDGPCYLRLGKAKEPVIHPESANIELGKAIQARSGTDLTLISTGAMLGETMNAAQRLAAKGIEARVLSLHTIKPLDEAAVIRAARKTGVVVTVEEHSVTGGLGSAVADVLLQAGVRVQFRKMGIPDRPYHVIGSQEFLRKQLIGDIAETALQLIRTKIAA
jgi:transketolase